MVEGWSWEGAGSGGRGAKIERCFAAAPCMQFNSEASIFCRRFELEQNAAQPHSPTVPRALQCRLAFSAPSVLPRRAALCLLPPVPCFLGLHAAGGGHRPPCHPRVPPACASVSRPLISPMIDNPIPYPILSRGSLHGQCPQHLPSLGRGLSARGPCPQARDQRPQGA